MELVLRRAAGHSAENPVTTTVTKDFM